MYARIYTMYVELPAKQQDDISSSNHSKSIINQSQEVALYMHIAQTTLLGFVRTAEISGYKSVLY